MTGFPYPEAVTAATTHMTWPDAFAASVIVVGVVVAFTVYLFKRKV